MKLGSLFAITALATIIHGHGLIKSPAARKPGNAFGTVCSKNVQGQAEMDEFQEGGPIEVWAMVGPAFPDEWDGAACNLYMCRGFKLDDNLDRVQEFAPGQTVPIKVDILAPHPGYANVSVIDLKTNTLIGEPLKNWPVYSPAQEHLPDDNFNFEVTIPDLTEKCIVPGDCAIQWYWYSNASVQTYESCIDFTFIA